MTPAERRGLMIRSARERLGWTQKDLAEHVGTGHKTVGNWERGRTSPRNRIGALEEVLGITLRCIPLGDAEPDRDERAIMALDVPEHLRLEWVDQLRRARREHARQAERPPA